MIEYIIWDFNGTVLDDAALCVEIENKQRTARGYAPVTLEDYREHFDFPVEAYYRRMGMDFTTESFADLSREYMAIFQPASLRLPLRPGVREVMQTLTQKGRKHVLLSASQKDNLLEQTDAFGITSLFEDILGLDDIYGKSKIELAVRWFKDNRINPKTAVMIGDTTHDYAVSQAVGCGCILLTGGHNSRARLEATGATVTEDVYSIPGTVLLR